MRYLFAEASLELVTSSWRCTSCKRSCILTSFCWEPLSSCRSAAAIDRDLLSLRSVSTSSASAAIPYSSAVSRCRTAFSSSLWTSSPGFPRDS